MSRRSTAPRGPATVRRARVPGPPRRGRLAILHTWLTLAALSVVGLMPAGLASATDPLTRVPAEFVGELAQATPATLTQWAVRFEHGEGVARDVDVAVALYCMAAERDHADAEYGLGWLYANGRGLGQSDSLAAAWMGRAARHGDSHAARLLPRIGALPDDANARCILSDGAELFGPLVPIANPSRRQVIDWVKRLAPRAGIDPTLVLAVIQVESGFNARARSPKDARGLMQLIPSTARRFGVEDIWDPLANLRGGVAYLTWLLEHFDGDVQLALAGYNAGEQAVARHRGIPPYAETRAYVRNVLKLCRSARAGRGRLADAGAGRAAARLKLHSCAKLGGTS